MGVLNTNKSNMETKKIIINGENKIISIGDRVIVKNMNTSAVATIIKISKTNPSVFDINFKVKVLYREENGGGHAFYTQRQILIEENEIIDVLGNDYKVLASL